MALDVKIDLRKAIKYHFIEKAPQNKLVELLIIINTKERLIIED